MKTALCTAVSLTALALTSISVDAMSLRLGHGDKSTTFSDLSLVNGSPDNGICARRYADDFTVKKHPNSLAEQRSFTTYEGHEIKMPHVSGSLETGLYSVENEYIITFPDTTQINPVRFQLMATGTIGETQSTGVCSDATYRGLIAMTLMKKTQLQ
ncbi:hypothetical protein SAMN04488518_108251 [Pseudovibrio ascidiaceicola]|uniref:VirK protein n=1 Tax=Pseudovibrio ascidiaceicola TaxID=285279 RepID=A0A1I4C0R3_9HYPH|nr:hypothetical protein [Pseudovibrio ascidiaceicola]SFK73939.1 hypothetical protein SAMN04488518_108251 [Pseudovibrio ascidiaceicola]